jgi:hypothetical protein
VFSKARVIVTLGNRAVHSHRSVPACRSASPRSPVQCRRASAVQLFDGLLLSFRWQRLESELQARDEKLAVLLADKSALDEELQRCGRRLQTHVKLRRRNRIRTTTRKPRHATISSICC